ncbi:MAG TPA: potassium transporter Kup [Dongiaceae bacterium]
MQQFHAGARRKSLSALAMGAIGVVYGDIGTSPLYALQECFSSHHGLAINATNIYGLLSLIFWSVTLVVSFKYVTIILRADNDGEGGSLALLAQVSGVVKGRLPVACITVLGVFAAALFYGDSMITPAISVLSAVEGLKVALPDIDVIVIPLTLVILAVLFVIQRQGTHRIGILFGPIMILWFGTLSVLGVIHILERPEVIAAINPLYAVTFFHEHGWPAFFVLGSVVLVLTGAEALYSDLGHFGRRPIYVAWFGLVLPSLVLNYFGQGALLLNDPSALENPFFRMAPGWAALPLVVLATVATVIASQAVISGAFSLTQQAIQLGLLPRLRIVHTSHQAIGQIYVPFVNWMLMVAVAMLVVGFETSANLASAYGLAVTGTMLITTLMMGVVLFRIWHWPKLPSAVLMAVFVIVDASFFLANFNKIVHGGWFTLAVGLVIFILLTTWKKGRQLLLARIDQDAMPVDIFLKSISNRAHRVPGTAIFMTGRPQGIPSALLHNLKHNKIIHERNILLTVEMRPVAHVPVARRLLAEDLGSGFHRLTMIFGFMDDPDVPAALRHADEIGLPINLMETSFFLSRETIVASMLPGMMLWREVLFAWMSRNATSAMDFFGLPINRVVELGTQVAI